MTFSLQGNWGHDVLGKSNWGHDVSLYTLNLLLAKTQKSIPNNFCDVFVQASDTKSI